jgi:type I restriction enzyme, S subunit
MLLVHIPPLFVQKKIAAIASAYDDLIENNDRRITLLEKMAEEIYREWFVRLRFPGHEQATFHKGIPNNWAIVKLEEIYRTSSGGTPSRQHPEYYGGHIPWVKTGELNNSFVLDSEEKITHQGFAKSSAKNFPHHTVVMAMYGATIGQLGILSVEATTNQACCAFLPKISALKYSYTYLLLKSIKDNLISFSFGGAQQNVSQDLIKKFKVLLPTYQIIDEFSTKVEPFYLKIETIYKARINLKQTRDRLLTRLISGKLSVEDLDIQFPPSMTEELEVSHDR